MSEAVSEVTQTTTTESAAPEAVNVSGGVPAEAAPATEAAAPAWTPDWKYKFENEERELDPFFRPLAKSQAELDRIKDIVQRADALERYKPKVKEYESKIGEYEPTVQNVKKLAALFQKGDHDSVLSGLGYTDEQLFQIVKNKLDRAQMPAEQKAIFEEKRRYELENQKLLEQNESYRSQAMQEMARTVNYEVDSELGKVNYSPIKDAYDKAYGSGAFRNLVLDRGAILVERAGRHVPPSEVIAMVAKEFAPFISQTQGTATSVQGTEPVAQHTNQTNQPKIIPQVGKGSGSATRGAVSSIDDLRKLKAAAM